MASVNQDDPVAKARKLLLTKFLQANSVDDFDKRPEWMSALVERPRNTIARFQSEGLVEPARPVDALGYLSATDLKRLLKERGLPVSGNKAELQQRLVNADPQGMQRLMASKGLLICTAQGARLAVQYRQNFQAQCDAAMDQTASLVASGQFEQAAMVMANYEVNQVFPRGLGINWKRYRPERDVRMLQLIYSLRPGILSRLTDAELNALRLPAAMMLLWATQRVKRWMPAIVLADNRFDLETAARMLEFAALKQSELEEMRSKSFIKQVAIASRADACPECRKFAGKTYSLDSLPELPHPGCTHVLGCHCTLIPVIEGI